MCCPAGSTRTYQDSPGTREDRLVLEVFLKSSLSSCGGQQGQHFSIFMVGGHMSPQSSRKGAVWGCMCAGVRDYAPRQSSLPPPQKWKDSELRQEEVTKIWGRNLRNKYPRSSSEELQPQEMEPDPQPPLSPRGSFSSCGEPALPSSGRWWVFHETLMLREDQGSSEPHLHL